MIDALGALEAGHLRRAVIDGALTCEVAAKEKLFGGPSIGAMAAGALEDKGALRVKVLDLVGAVAAEVFGHSFEVEHPSDYKNVRDLFDARNKAAHRGELYVRDNRVKRPVTAKLVEDWLGSADKLLEWLDAL